MSDTPLTDEMLKKIGDPLNSDNPRTSLCRDLERKLAVARTALKGLADYESWSMPDLYSQPCCDEMVENMNTIAKEALDHTLLR